MTFRSRVIHALSWSAFTQIFNVVLGLIVSVILARLLSPQDFGMVAIVTGIMALVIGLADFGFTALIIKGEKFNTQELDSLFTVRLLLAISQSILLCLVATPVARYFGHQELATAIRVMSLMFPLSALSLVPDALLRKRLEFRKLALTNTIAACISGVAGIALALSGAGYWSLVAQYLISAICAAVLLACTRVWRPALAFNVAPLTTNRHYILNTYGLNIMGAIVLQGDKLLLGKLLGAVNLGFYMRAFGLAQQVQGFAMAVAEQVSFPALADSGGDPARTQARFLRIVQEVCRLVAPVMLAIAVLARPLVLFLYGEQWSAAAPILQVVVLGLLMNALNAPWDWLIRTTESMQVLFRWSLIDGPTRLLAMFVGAMSGGALGAAWGFFVMALLWFFARAWIMGRATGVAPWTFLAVFPRPLLPAVVATTIIHLSLASLQHFQLYLQLGLSGVAGVASYFIAAFVLLRAASTNGSVRG